MSKPAASASREAEVVGDAGAARCGDVAERAVGGLWKELFDLGLESGDIFVGCLDLRGGVSSVGLRIPASECASQRDSGRDRRIFCGGVGVAVVDGMVAIRVGRA